MAIDPPDRMLERQLCHLNLRKELLRGLDTLAARIGGARLRTYLIEKAIERLLESEQVTVSAELRRDLQTAPALGRRANQVSLSDIMSPAEAEAVRRREQARRDEETRRKMQSVVEGSCIECGGVDGHDEGCPVVS